MSRLGEIRLLSSRLREELSKDPWEDEAIRPLAAAYNSYCRALRTRLDQVRAVLEDGDKAQAIDLAEADPPVLDQLTILGSPDLSELEDWCKETGLPFEGRFDGQLIHRINEAFSDSGVRDGALEKVYRGAVLRKDFDAAISALRSMLRSRPEDERLKEELGGLIDRYGKALAKKLGQSSELDRQKELIEKIEDIGRSDLLDLPTVDAVRQKLQKLADRDLEERINDLLKEAENYESLDTWEDFEECFGRISLLLEQLSRPPDPGIVEQWKALQEAERELRQRWTSAREKELAGNQLDSVVRSATQRRVKAEILEDETLGKALDSLIAAAERAEKAGVEIDGELKDRWKREVSEIRSLKVRRARERRKRKIVAGVAAAFVLGAVILMVADYVRYRNFSSEVETVLLQKNGASARQIVSGYEESPPASVFRSGMSRQVDRLIAFRQREERIDESIRNNLGKLEAFLESEDEPSPIDLADAERHVSDVSESLKEISTETKQDLLPRWEAGRDRLALVRLKIRAQLHEQLDELLAQVKPSLDTGLSLNNNPEKLRGEIAKANRVRSAINETYGPWDDSVALREDQVEQIRSVEGAVEDAEKQLRLHDSLSVRIETALTLDDYFAAVEELAALQYPGSSLTDLNQTLSQKVDVGVLTKSFIGREYPFASDWIEAESLPELVPKGELLPSEGEVYMSLLDDNNLSGIYESTFDQGGDEWMKPRKIYSKGPLRIVSRTSWREQTGVTGQIYVPDLSPFKVEFTLQEDKQLIKLDQKGESPESKFYGQLGLDRNISGSGQIIPTRDRPAPFLDAIDRILASEELDPVYKIFLIQKLYQIMMIAERESSWGLDFLPPMPPQFRKLLDFSVQSGEWMFPANEDFPSNKKKAEEAAALVESLEGVIPPLQRSVLFARELIRNLQGSRLEFIETKVPGRELTVKPDEDRSIFVLVGKGRDVEWHRLDESNLEAIIDFTPILELVPSFSEIIQRAAQEAEVSPEVAEQIVAFLRN